MLTLDYQLDADSTDSPAIGLVVLQSDETMEHELRGWLPGRYRLFHSRIPNEQHINAESLTAMGDRLPGALKQLPQATEYAAILYGCTSATLMLGEKTVTARVQSVFPGAAVTNPLSAIKQRLSAMNARSICLLAPYIEPLVSDMAEHLIQSGYSVKNVASFQEPQDERVARISALSLQQGVQTLLEQTPTVDAVVLACTNLRTQSWIDHFSQSIALPVISSNSALAWHIQRLVDRPASSV